MTEESILFPEVKVGDIVVKPWSFGMLFSISEDLEQVLNRMEETDLISKLEKSGGLISYTLLARIFTIASNHVLKIIAVTINKTEDEVRALSMEDGMKIAMIIYNQNKQTIMSSLKNVFSPSVQESPEGQ